MVLDICAVKTQILPLSKEVYGIRTIQFTRRLEGYTIFVEKLCVKYIYSWLGS